MWKSLRRYQDQRKSVDRLLCTVYLRDSKSLFFGFTQTWIALSFLRRKYFPSTFSFTVLFDTSAPMFLGSWVKILCLSQAYSIRFIFLGSPHLGIWQIFLIGTLPTWSSILSSTIYSHPLYEHPIDPVPWDS